MKRDTRGVRTLVALLLFGPMGCAPLPQFPFAAHADLAPPRILALGFDGPAELLMTFDEPCTVVDNSLIPGATLDELQVGFVRDESVVRFRFSQAPEAAVEHSLEAQVADGAGNHLRFVARFYGLNDLLPAMIINEFTTQGSDTHPDFVEIRVLTDGNLAGSCLLEGIPGDWDDRYVFPDVTVSAGDYIVVHFKPEGLAEEVDELTSQAESGGRDATDSAWDFWVPGGGGLSGNNGVVVLCENPVGGIIDAVLYSNRTSSSDERYRGFGSARVLAWADYLAAEDAWAHSGMIRPEDAVNPEDSTSTRSMCRGSDGEDSNSREDWHITPTRGLSPGGENTDTVYVP